MRRRGFIEMLGLCTGVSLLIPAISISDFASISKRNNSVVISSRHTAKKIYMRLGSRDDYSYYKFNDDTNCFEPIKDKKLLDWG